ncbi:hypothetical protein FANTH_3982 [Fusarium anthophilum]|uniref:CBM-cenC domain-containing protein n=1 Tax=Fusarium anthophilum TaxID=48485 RepID=A0A8H4ZQS5_9HYPO|nr:hypothetical protein FANTH_3982 [Fusarium anthophilum]
MVSNKLIVAAFVALASVANASPCKPSSSRAITTSAAETATSSTYIETSTAITESETATTATDATTEALTTEASTTIAESATTTTTVDEPLLTNAGFEDGTTGPWQLLTEHEDALAIGSGFQSPASGKVMFGSDDGSQYATFIIQKINKQALKAGSYDLQGRTLVDSYSQSGDGCSVIIAACLTGSGQSSVLVPASMSRASAENSEGHWSQIETTCSLTDEMLAGDEDISVVFGFFCANSAVYLDSVELKPAAVIPNTDTTTVAASSETSMNLEPWLSTRSETVARDTDNPFECPACVRLKFGIDNYKTYYDYFYQKIDTKDLKAASYRLSGSIHVDSYNNNINGDGCNSLALGCTLGGPNNFDRVPGSTVMGSLSGAVNNWVPLDATCTLTEDMLSHYDYVRITFGFSCVEVGANLEEVI